MENHQTLTAMPVRKPAAIIAPLEQSLAYLSEGLIVINSQFVIQYINAAAKQLLKLHADSALVPGNSLLSWSIEEQTPLVFHTVEELFKGEPSINRRLYNHYHNQWVHLYFQRLQVPEGSEHFASITLKNLDDHSETSGFEDLINSIEGIIWEADPVTFDINFVSEQAPRLLGYPASVWYQPGFWGKYIHPDDVATAIETCTELVRQGVDHTLEYRMIAADGEVLWVKDVIKVVKEDGVPKSLRGLLIDISKEKQAAQLLAEKDELFKAIVHHSFDVIALLDTEFKVKYASPSIPKILGYVEEDLMGKSGLDIVAPQMRNDAAAKLMQIVQNEDIDRAEIQFVHKNGSLVLMEVLGKNLLHNRYIGGVLISMRDITEKKRLEQELVKSEVTHLKTITQTVINTQEKERKKIANELHDNINQLLSATKLMLDTARDMEPLREKLIGNASDTLMQAINEIRLLTSSLVVYDIQDLGIYDSVQKLIANLSLTSAIKGVAKINKKVDERLDGNARTHLYRIIQEHLTNVHKHSKATKVLLTIAVDDDNVVLTIKDNGVGFDMAQKRKGIGLSNITHRVQILNGVMNMDAAPGKGCLLQVTV